MRGFKFTDCDDQGRAQTTCPSCSGKTIMRLDVERFHAWANGMLIQNAFPEFSAEQRETLITGLCNSCQEKIYS